MISIEEERELKIACFSCDKHIDVTTCGACREITKHLIAGILRGTERVYLTETTRHKRGRKPKLSLDKQEELTKERIIKGYTFRKLAKKYKVSPATANKVYHKRKANLLPYYKREEDLN